VLYYDAFRMMQRTMITPDNISISRTGQYI